MQTEKSREWSGCAMALGNLPVLGRPTIWMVVGQGPTALAVDAGGLVLGLFTLIYSFSPLSPFLWKTARYRLRYCLKGPSNPNQPTNQPRYPNPVVNGYVIQVTQNRLSFKYTNIQKKSKKYSF